MLKRKNDRQPPQSLDELYPDDYWLDEEDGEEELPDPAMKKKPVSGRLHDEPMVTGYEALERQRGVRRPNRKLTRREKKALKRAQKYEEKLHVFYVTVNSKAYEEYVPGSIPSWMQTMYIVDVVIAVLLVLAEVLLVRGYLKKKKSVIIVETVEKEETK